MTDVIPLGSCDQPECPILTEGRCLEGLAGAVGCPHFKSGAVVPTYPPVASPVDLEASAREESSRPDVDWVYIGGDDALDLEQAHAVAAEYGATVILIAGEYESGKTTILVELFGRFLRGRFAGLTFAGTKTLDAFDKRHFLTRFESGRPRATTAHTTEEDMRVVHLRIWDGTRHRVLMPTDIKGEFFERLIEGRPVSTEVSIAARADKTIILIDGDRVRDSALRQAAIVRGRQLIGSLTEPGGVCSGRPLAIVLSKLDHLSSEDEEWFEQQVPSLCELAQARGADPVQVMRIAARPEEDPDNPRGLAELLTWMCQNAGQCNEDTVPSGRRAGRFFWGCRVEVEGV